MTAATNAFVTKSSVIKPSVTRQCILLAAGLSSRMGSWKMALPWRNGTVLDQALNNALGFCDKVILVTGFRGDELQRRYAGRRDIVLCHNSHYQQGMFSSLQCGVQQLETARFFVAPADMPDLPASLYATLWQQRSTACLVPVTENGRHGHPVLLPAPMIARIRQAPPDTSLRKLILDFGRQSLNVTNNGIHQDLDTPQQYQALLRQIQHT